MNPRISESTLTWYRRHRYQLIPLTNTLGSADDPGSLGKKPLLKDWPNVRIDESDLIKYAATHNLGCRLGPRDFVIDVDPRNGGHAGLKSLLDSLAISRKAICATFPTVSTGSGGFHFYMTIPTAALVENPRADGKYRTSHPDFPGIDFKNGRGHQLVIPGSYHFGAGEYYKWHSDPTLLESVSPAPAALLDLLTYRDAPADTQPVSLLTPEQLEDLLARLDPEDYSTNEDWFPLLAASHCITGGQGLDEFIAWSTSDPQYAEHGSIIYKRWKSLKPPSPDEKTLGYFRKELSRASQDIPEYLQSATRKDYLYEPIPDALLDDILAGQEGPTLASVQSRIESMGSDASTTDRADVLHDIALLDPLARHDAKEFFIRQTRSEDDRIIIDQALRDIVRDFGNMTPLGKKRDVPLEIAQYLLANKFENGRILAHAADQRYWTYTGKVWEPLAINKVEELIVDAGLSHQRQNPDLDYVMSSKLAITQRVLSTRCVVPRSFLDSEPPSVVNCANCEIWIDPETGDVTVKDHSPESYLIHHVPVAYDPEATCPAFDAVLLGIFGDLPDYDFVIDLIWEIFGYIIQPSKDLTAWFMFHGRGRSGKSTLTNILKALIGGPSVVSESVSAFDISKHPHAYAKLVGKLLIHDEEVSAGTVLPDAFMKKISERTSMTSNPKNRAEVQFLNTAALLLSTNMFPYVRTLDSGFCRRPVVVPFTHHFSDAEIDTGLARRIIRDELPGVLRGALRGLRRLRHRNTGFSDLPGSCQTAAKRWFSESNHILAFSEEHYDLDPALRTPLRDVWEQYKVWCYENGINKRYDKRGMRLKIVEHNPDLTVRRSTGNKHYIFGLAEKENSGS